MYSLIFTSFLLTTFAITLVDKNYLLLKLRCQKQYKSRLEKNSNDYFKTKFKNNIFSIQKPNEMLFSYKLWYLFPARFIKLHEPMDPRNQATFGRNVTERKGKHPNKKKDKVLPKKIIKLPPLKADEIDFVRYHSLDKIYNYMESLRWKYPHIVNIESIGQSFEERDIKLMKVSTGDVGTKTTILIVGGMNSNEWISPATIIYSIQQLVENPVNRYMLGKADWLFIPLTNPDGYEYSFKTNHSWKKTRSSQSNNCTGVNLNKNFDHTCINLTSKFNDSCGDLYAGSETFSEQEAKALLDLITEGVHIQLFVNINNYGQSLEFPLDNAKKFIQDSKDLQYLAEKVSYAVDKYGGRKYTIKGVNSCGSEQWVRTVGVKYSYNLKLPLKNKDKLQVAEKDILSIAQEVFVAFRELQQVLETIYSVSYDLISED